MGSQKPAWQSQSGNFFSQFWVVLLKLISSLTSTQWSFVLLRTHPHLKNKWLPSPSSSKANPKLGNTATRNRNIGPMVLYNSMLLSDCIRGEDTLYSDIVIYSSYWKDYLKYVHFDKIPCKLFNILSLILISYKYVLPCQTLWKTHK